MSFVLSWSQRQPIETINLDRTQSVMVLKYLSSVLSRIEVIGESRIMPHVVNFNLVPMVIDHLVTHLQKFKTEAVVSAATFLAAAFDTEAFEDDRSAFLPASAKAQVHSEE